MSPSRSVRLVLRSVVSAMAAVVSLQLVAVPAQASPGEPVIVGELVVGGTMTITAPGATSVGYRGYSSSTCAGDMRGSGLRVGSRGDIPITSELEGAYIHPVAVYGTVPMWGACYGPIAAAQVAPPTIEGDLLPGSTISVSAPDALGWTIEFFAERGCPGDHVGFSSEPVLVGGERAGQFVRGRADYGGSAEHTDCVGPIGLPEPTVAGDLRVGGTVTIDSPWAEHRRLVVFEDETCTGAPLGDQSADPDGVLVLGSDTLAGLYARAVVAKGEADALGSCLGPLRGPRPPLPTLSGPLVGGGPYEVVSTGGTDPGLMAVTAETCEAHDFPLVLPSTGTVPGALVGGWVSPVVRDGEDWVLGQCVPVAAPVITVVGDLVSGRKVSVGGGTSGIEQLRLFDDPSCQGEGELVERPYLLQDSDVGRYVKAFHVVDIRADWSGCTGPVVAAPEPEAPPAVTLGPPSITGDARVGSTLICAAGSGVLPGDGVGYAWSDGPVLVGQEAAYVVPPGALGRRLTCTVTVTRTGHLDGVGVARTSVVRAGVLSVGPPTITGTARVGEQLICTPPVGDDLVVRSVVWRSGGAAVGSGDVRVVGAADVGRVLTCAVTVGREGYEDAVVTATSGPVALAAAPDVAVSLVGRARVGETLRARLEGLPAGAEVTWQWLRDGEPVEGATSDERALTPRDWTRRITAVATVDLPGHEVAIASATSEEVGLLRLLMTVEPVGPRARVVDVTVGRLLPGESWVLSLGSGLQLGSGRARPDGTAEARVRLPRALDGATTRFINVRAQETDRKTWTSIVVGRRSETRALLS